jgi:DNA-binding phage protein
MHLFFGALFRVLCRVSPEESGTALDRLAELLAKHPPDRRALLWSETMGKQPVFDLTAISGQLKAAIVASGMTHYAIGKAAGVSSGMFLRFISGERDLRLETVDKLAAALGLRLCQDRDPENWGAYATLNLKTSEV